MYSAARAPMARHHLHIRSIRIQQTNPRHRERARFHCNPARLPEQLVAFMHAHNQRMHPALHRQNPVQMPYADLRRLALRDRTHRRQRVVRTRLPIRIQAHFHRELSPIRMQPHQLHADPHLPYPRRFKVLFQALRVQLPKALRHQLGNQLARQRTLFIPKQKAHTLIRKHDHALRIHQYHRIRYDRKKVCYSIHCVELALRIRVTEPVGGEFHTR